MMKKVLLSIFLVTALSGCGAGVEVANSAEASDQLDMNEVMIDGEFAGKDPLLVEAYLLVPRQQVSMPDFDDVPRELLASYRDCVEANNNGVFQDDGDSSWQSSIMRSDCAFEAGLDGVFDLWIPPSPAEMQEDVQRHFLDEIAPCLRLEGFEGEFPTLTNQHGELFDIESFAATPDKEEMLDACIDHHGHE